MVINSISFESPDKAQILFHSITAVYFHDHPIDFCVQKRIKHLFLFEYIFGDFCDGICIFPANGPRRKYLNS